MENTTEITEDCLEFLNIFSFPIFELLVTCQVKLLKEK